MTAFTDNIRRIMGWCPQKDFVGHVRTEKHEHYFLTSYETGAYSGKTMKILTDYQWSKILYAGSAAFFIFLIEGLVFPNLVFFAVLSILSVFLTALILFIQDRTTIEFTSNAIIIKRPLFKPVEILKDNILKIGVIKNPNNRFRWAIISLVIIALIYGSMNAIDTLSRSMARDPVPFFILFVFQQSTLLIFIIVVAYKWYIRSPYENFLKITSRSKGEVTVYLDNPWELAGKLGDAQ